MVRNIVGGGCHLDTVTLICQAVIRVVFYVRCSEECCPPYLSALVTIVGTPATNLMVLCAPSSTFMEEMRTGVSSDGENYQKQFNEAFFFSN